MLKVNITEVSAKVKSRSHHDADHVQLQPMTLPSIKIKPKVKITPARSKVLPRSHDDAAHLHPETNVPTEYFNVPTLKVSEIQPRLGVKDQGHES